MNCNDWPPVICYEAFSTSVLQSWVLVALRTHHKAPLRALCFILTLQQPWKQAGSTASPLHLSCEHADVELSTGGQVSLCTQQANMHSRWILWAAPARYGVGCCTWACVTCCVPMWAVSLLTTGSHTRAL